MELESGQNCVTQKNTNTGDIMRRHGQTQMPCPNWTHSSVTADMNVALSLVHNLFHLMEYFSRF